MRGKIWSGFVEGQYGASAGEVAERERRDAPRSRVATCQYGICHNPKSGQARRTVAMPRDAELEARHPRVSRRARVLFYRLVVVMSCLAAANWLRAAGVGRTVHASEIDRLLAVVNGRVITEGDLQIARNLNALVSFGKEAAQPSREEALGRVIDMELMRQEFMSFAVAPAEQSKVETFLLGMKEAYAEIGGLGYLLKRLELQEAELRNYLALRISVEKFVDLRFRPFVNVSEDEVRSYFQDRLSKQLHVAGAVVPPLSEVAPRIETLLREEKVNIALESWIQEIRRHSKIEILPLAEPDAGGQHP